MCSLFIGQYYERTICRCSMCNKKTLKQVKNQVSGNIYVYISINKYFKLKY